MDDRSWRTAFCHASPSGIHPTASRHIVARREEELTIRPEESWTDSTKTLLEGEITRSDAIENSSFDFKVYPTCFYDAENLSDSNNISGSSFLALYLLRGGH